MRMIKTVLTAGAAVALAQASAAQARVQFICTQYSAAHKTLNIEVSSGCISSSLQYAGNDISLAVEPTRASIRVSGDIKYSGGGHIHSKDCMARKTIELSESTVDARLYSLSYNDQFVGTLDLLNGDTPRKCHSISRQRVADPQAINSGKFEQWRLADQYDYAEWSGSSLSQLLEPIVSQYSAEEEGRLTLEIRVSKMKWYPRPMQPHSQSKDGFVAVEIERLGVGDDSVSGDRLFGEAVFEDGTWHLRNLWRQNMCVRGQYAGQWTKELCP